MKKQKLFRNSDYLKLITKLNIYILSPKYAVTFLKIGKEIDDYVAILFYITVQERNNDLCYIRYSRLFRTI